MDSKVQHNVAVAVRVRPLIRTEINDGCVNEVLANSFRHEVKMFEGLFIKMNISGLQVHVKSDSRIYTYDSVFDQSASQRDVFGCCEPLLQNILKGN